MTRDDLDSTCRILVDQELCSAEGLTQRLSALLDMDNADYLAAEEDGAIVGVALSIFDGFTRFVSHMAVAPGAERWHIGRQMIDDTETCNRPAGTG